MRKIHLLAVVLVAFSTSRIVFIQQIGVGLAIAVVMDATLVRVAGACDDAAVGALELMSSCALAGHLAAYWAERRRGEYCCGER